MLGAFGLGLLTAPTGGWGGAACLASALAAVAMLVPLRTPGAPPVPVGAEVELVVESGWLHLSVSGSRCWSRWHTAARWLRTEEHCVLTFGGDDALAVPSRVSGVADLDLVARGPSGSTEAGERAATAALQRDPYAAPAA